jgi:Ca-activated chloride channel family protein
VLTLAWPWLLTLLPLPWLYRLAARPARARGAALRSAHYARLTGQLATTGAPTHTWRHGLLALIWLALLLAAARPTWTGEPVTLPTSGRDLMLAVDISDSMRIADMAAGNEWLPRVTVVKAVVGDFVARREGDRLGLILFGSQAYLQAPLTFDRRTVKTLLDEARIGFAGLSTAMGDAIAIAIKRLEGRPATSKVLILLSDGADTASEVPPLKAAELAARHGVRIHTIGVGSGELTARGLFGERRFNPSADLDEDTLTAIAEATGGRYFRARDPAELAEVYAALDALEPVVQEGETLRPTRALFHWPLAVALLGWALLLATAQRRGDHG